MWHRCLGTELLTAYSFAEVLKWDYGSAPNPNISFSESGYVNTNRLAVFPVLRFVHGKLFVGQI